MKSYIKAIMIFNEKGEVRNVPMKPGVNIITGDSKTGKSALVEIIDYCLCSSRCTIPKGIITDFAYLYVMPMSINDITYIIARYKKETGKMYVVKESADFNVNNITLDYFYSKPCLDVKYAQNEIESALGLYVSNTVIDEERQGRKASLRNMVSYLFQHQNLMASKFALFYRFSDFYKRKDIIEQFPVFAGLIDQEYYSDLIELNSLKAQLKKKKKEQKFNEKGNDYVRRNLLPLVQDYYALLSIPFNNNISTKELLKIASNLPEFDESEFMNEKGIADRYHDLNNKLDELRDKEREILIKIDNLGDAGKNGEQFTQMLKELKEQTDIGNAYESKYVCPICGNECKDILQQDEEILEATKWLNNELEITSKYTNDFSEDVRKLKGLHEEILGEIKSVWQQIKFIENKFINSKELVSKREKANYARARINLYKDMRDSGLFKNVDEDIAYLESKIDHLQKKINEFNIDGQKEEAQTFINDNMNRLSKTLDFEEEYRPINLKFGLIDETFDIYQHQNKHENIYLYEMGSGANWVSCHIALFLSFLRYFATQKKSPMLLTMFFDQPSQVYFPQGTINENNKEVSQTDLKAVNDMYKTIFDEINNIGKETGVLPQILIVDHVDGNDLEIKDEFLSYVRKDWRNGEALI